MQEYAAQYRLDMSLTGATAWEGQDLYGLSVFIDTGEERMESRVMIG